MYSNENNMSIPREPLSVDAVKAAVNGYYLRGWLPIPLTLDAGGFPKRPITPGWPRLTRSAATLRGLPWDGCYGMGLVLGAASGNLAAIDIDDVDLAAAAVAYLVRSHQIARVVWTVRRRIHVYCQEETASASTAFTVNWRGQAVQVELKAAGTQVAAPPTPGYVLAADYEPWPVAHVADAWGIIAAALGVERHQPGEGAGTGRAGYPQPWRPAVHTGERNRAIYIEACKLREAQMPLDQALGIMRARVKLAYEPGETAWGEIERTIKSAYKRGLKIIVGRGRVSDDGIGPSIF